MTCDESRPCKRCFQRGLQDTCVDAPRKKKKYLLDVSEDMAKAPGSEAMSRSGTNTSASPPTAPVTTPGGPAALPSLPSLMDQIKSDSSVPTQQLPMINELYPPQLSFSRSTSMTQPSQNQQKHYVPAVGPNQQQQRQHTRHSKFMSNAADSEYSILSDIIRQDDIDLGIHRHSQAQSESQSPHFHDNGHHRKDSSVMSSGSTPNSQSLQHDIYSTYSKGDKTINQYMLGFVQDKMVTLPEALKSIEGERQFSTDPFPDPSLPVLSFSIAISESSDSPSQTTTASLSHWGLRFKEAEEIYAKVSRPFSYTPGFHALIAYLKTRFARTELIQMAKAISSYRPSFIACTNTLKEDDLIFMEQCFQRTLLEYDKFISLSGTPTIVWRRTGQIAYVSEEFCILTGWTKEQLLNKITFIVELMDDSSVLEYFNLFSAIAYGDFRGATMAGCTLLTPNDTRVKTTCIWTLKRDVFGIPMMMIGNFLPIL